MAEEQKQNIFDKIPQEIKIEEIIPEEPYLDDEGRTANLSIIFTGILDLSYSYDELLKYAEDRGLFKSDES